MFKTQGFIGISLVVTLFFTWNVIQSVVLMSHNSSESSTEYPMFENSATAEEQENSPSPISELQTIKSIPTPPPTLRLVSVSTPSPQPTLVPTSFPKISYEVRPSESSVNMQASLHQSKSLSAELFANGQRVTDFRNIDYVWRLEDESLAEIVETGSQSIEIKSKKAGTSILHIVVFPKGEGENLTKITIPITITSTPPQIRISFPSEGQSISTVGQFCVVDVPTRGNHDGLQSRYKINTNEWTSYTPHTTLCYTPSQGSNSLELQYKNQYELESDVIKVNFIVN